MGGIILGALGGLGDGLTTIGAQQDKRDDLTLESNLAQQRTQALEQFKQQMEDQQRQRMADNIGAAAQPILDQGIVAQAINARTNQLDGSVPSGTAADGQAYTDGGFAGDANSVLSAIKDMQPGPDRDAALAQFQQQLQDQRSKVGALSASDLTDAERQKFAPTDTQTRAARLAAAEQLGYIAPKDVLSANSRQEIAALRTENAIQLANMRGEMGMQIANARGDTARDVANARVEASRDNTQARIDAEHEKWERQNTLSPEMQQTAQAIAAGQLPPISGYGLRSPGANLIMAEVMRLNPDYDANAYGASGKAEKDFATGKQGNAVRSFNVAISHLGTLSTLADALQNGNMRAFNELGNSFATQTGSPAPTNFEAVKHIVGDEIVKAVTGSGGALGDRDAAAKTLDAANSPAQLKGVVNSYLELMKGQLNGLRDQYKATTGRTDFDDKYLSDAAKAVLHPAATGTPAATAASGVARIASDAEYNSLPSGALFVGPDGATRRKP